MIRPSQEQGAIHDHTKNKTRRFTAIDKLDIALSPGINVFVDSNGTGKIHLMELPRMFRKFVQATNEFPNMVPTHILNRIGLRKYWYVPNSLTKLHKPVKLRS